VVLVVDMMQAGGALLKKCHGKSLALGGDGNIDWAAVAWVGHTIRALNHSLGLVHGVVLGWAAAFIGDTLDSE